MIIIADLYNVTTKLKAFTYTTGVKPYICEWPTVKDDQFLLFNKILRVVPTIFSTSDHDIERDVGTDVEEFDLEIKAVTFAKINAVIADIKQGCRDFVPDTIYSVLYVDNDPYEVDKTLIIVKLKMRATLSGVIY